MRAGEQLPLMRVNLLNRTEGTLERRYEGNRIHLTSTKRSELSLLRRVFQQIDFASQVLFTVAYFCPLQRCSGLWFYLPPATRLSVCRFLVG
jgi:hypothetical protein